MHHCIAHQLTFGIRTALQLLAHTYHLLGIAHHPLVPVLPIFRMIYLEPMGRGTRLIVPWVLFRTSNLLSFALPVTLAAAARLVVQWQHQQQQQGCGNDDGNDGVRER